MDVPSPPALRCSSEPGLISIPDPIHNPGLRERGPNEEMKLHGKGAVQRSKEGRGTAEEASFSVLVYLSLFLSVPDVKERYSEARVAAKYTKMCIIFPELLL